MDKDLDNKRFVFATIFQIANSLQVFLDKHLKEDNITGKQFMLMIIIGSFGNDGGLLTQVSERAGTSHQNAKQIANKLEKNGYIEMTKDEKDLRALRLKLTDKAKEYWNNRTPEDIDMLNMLFQDTTSENLGIVSKELINMLGRLKEMETNSEN